MNKVSYTESDNKRTRRYSDEFKQQVVTRAAEIGLSKAAAEFDVSVESVRKWRMIFKDIVGDVKRVEDTIVAGKPIDEGIVEDTAVVVDDVEKIAPV